MAYSTLPEFKVKQLPTHQIPASTDSSGELLSEYAQSLEILLEF